MLDFIFTREFFVAVIAIAAVGFLIYIVIKAEEAEGSEELIEELPADDATEPVAEAEVATDLVEEVVEEAEVVEDPDHVTIVDGTMVIDGVSVTDPVEVEYLENNSHIVQLALTDGK